MSFEKMNNGFIVDGLMSVYNDKVKQMLKDLSLNYTIKEGSKAVSLDELYNKYCISDLVFDDSSVVKKKKRKKNKQLAKDELCMAKKRMDVNVQDEEKMVMNIVVSIWVI